MYLVPTSVCVTFCLVMNNENGWMDKWMDEWMMDGWMDIHICTYVYACTHIYAHFDGNKKGGIGKRQ